MLQRILSNLVSNSVQAMPNGGKLTISAYEEAGNTLIEVQDSGVGIPQEVKSKMFTPLFTTKAKGTGLGLSVCKQIMGMHEGEIGITSEQGKGTSVTVQFPKRRSKIDG